jgi:predicted alpha/beta-fold hydrolase
MGARAPAVGVRIARFVGVCPGLVPATTRAALARGPAIYRKYFLFKWRRSLRAKQEAWPDHYDFRELLAEPSLTTMTERMVLKYTDYPDLGTYLRGYAITGPALESLEAPTCVITSRDDPMILPHDLERLARPPALQLRVTARGGHCGYMDALAGPSWIDRTIVAELDRE